MTASTNPREVIGANNPPADEPTPFQKAKERIEDLYAECALWLDGAEVETQEVADGIGNLLTMIRDAEAEAEALRVAENDPFDKGKAEVQARYNPLIADNKSVKGKTTLAKAACLKVLTVWNNKVAEKLAEEQRIAREAAMEAERKAQEAIRAANPENLAEVAAAEELIQHAKTATITANKTDRMTAKSGGAVGRSIGLRSYWIHEITDPIAFGRYAWEHCKPEYLEFLNMLAKRLVDGGKHELPGLKITEEKRAA